MSCSLPVETQVVQEKRVWRHSVCHPPSSVFSLPLTRPWLYKYNPAVSADGLIDSTSAELVMDHTQSFSVLNERLKPRFNTREQIFSSLNRLEDRQSTSLRSKCSSYREPEVSKTEPGDPEEPEDDSGQEDLVCDEGNCADLLNNSCLITELSLNDFGGEEVIDDNRSISSSEEKDQPGELTSEGTGLPSETGSLDDEGGTRFKRSYVNEALPDLVNGGKPLGRRRTLGHVSETLKEVRREVELSRRRSIKLKAQVDKLQEGRDGPGWSQHRERVTEDILSVVRLLYSLAEEESSPPELSAGVNRLDASLAQLQIVAHKLVINHTKQSKSGNGNGAEDSAVLQQALRDRDEAIEKKKAMEAELLRSKTELMMLNNHLLEAVQKRLELSLELETWKEDVQRILHQQIQSQQQAEQKKPSRLGILRRNNKAPIQRPSNFPMSSPVSPTVNHNQIFVPRSPVLAPSSPCTPSPTTIQRNWRDKLRRAKNGRQGDQESEGRGEDDGFQVVSLD